MIFRRLAESLRRQNWFVVFLEIMIVVLGVFLGIQVANWNEARAAAEMEIQLVDRLTYDLRGMRASFNEYDDIALRTHQGWSYAFRALEQCRANPDHQDAINYSFSRYQTTFAPRIQRSAFDEMQSTGAFSRLEDGNLKNAVVTLYANLETEKISVMVGRDNQLAAGRIMWKSIAFSFLDDDPYALGFDAWGVAAFNPLEHCDNLELRGAIWEMVDISRDWLTSSAEFVAEIESILSELEKVQR